ncbi:MAG TPA: UPF0182 family protein [bacterium]|nr:UPF0182 family protein [bacterium]
MRRRGVVLIGLAVFLLAVPRLAVWYTEWLWFGAVGYRSIFWIPILSSWPVGTAAALSVFLILFLNVRPLLRPGAISRIITLLPAEQHVHRQIVLPVRPGTLIAIIVGVVSVLAGVAASGSWLTFQMAFHQEPFGVRDPVFHRDVGFYVFTLPAIWAAYGWVFGWLLIALLVVATVYYLDVAPLAMQGVWAVPRGARNHLALLVGILLLVRAIGFWLNRYGLLFSSHQVLFGADYVDLHARLPVLQVLVLLSAAAGILMLVTIRLRTVRPAVRSLALLVAVWFGGLALYPAFIQQVRVTPNQLSAEAPYLRADVEATLRAYHLDQVQQQLFPATGQLTAATVHADQALLDGIRLWDDRALLPTYSQLQSLRTYYTFTSIGIDRYWLGGHEQQVMIAAREMDTARLPSVAHTWVNEHLVFTHGYGLVMSPVSKIAGEGLPDFYISDIPPTSSIGLTVARPQLYYSMLSAAYAIVGTRTNEFDYAQGEHDVYTTYAGTGGVPLDAPLARLAFALRYVSSPLALSTQITPQSRIMLYRAVAERVAHIAPFLALDSQPYLVLADGRLYWIVDAYTTSAAGYPYSRPEGGINYIRNSVKAVVDAYNGTTRFYVVDPTDPLIQTYGRIFPGLFRPLTAMPPALVAHLRYPLDLFTLQAQVYATFHMTDPRVFYNREDAWATPNELFGATPQPLAPYYVNVQLDPKRGSEFALILPLTPLGKDNMVAWMAGRSDPPNYGRLLVYQFPKSQTVFGPMQIEARINQDPTISAALTLWSQQGSHVIRGDLLVVPIADSVLYIEPLYLQAEGSALPELKRVIVIYRSQVVMEPTLNEALDRIFGAPSVRQPPASSPGGPQALPPTASQSAPVPGRIASLVAEESATYARARAALRAGDFATYARDIDALGRILKELQDATQAR